MVPVPCMLGGDHYTCNQGLHTPAFIDGQFNSELTGLALNRVHPIEIYSCMSS